MKCKLTALVMLAVFCIFIFQPLTADEIADLKNEVKVLKEQFEMQKAMMEELMGDQTSTAAKQEFKIAGFIEFRYENMDIEAGPWIDATQTGSKVSYKLWKNRERGAFSVRNLNVYSDFTYGKNVRAFMEVKYMEYPSGGTKYTGDPTVTDDGNGSFISHGSIYIERAWVDYKLKDSLKLQVGKLLTPFGIWNVEHGAPVLPSIRVPASISYGFVPTNFVGINIHGNKLLGNWEVEYNAWVSNGRGVWNVETNANKGIGASLNIKAPVKFLNKLVFGGSYYKGKENLDYSQKFYAAALITNADSKQETVYNTYYDIIKNTAREYCITGHVSLSWKKLDINYEYVYNNIKYENYNAVDNLNNRLFYRPDNAELVEGVAASATLAQLNAGLQQAKAGGLLTGIGITDNTNLATASATMNGVVAQIDATGNSHPLYGQRTTLLQLKGGIDSVIAGFDASGKTMNNIYNLPGNRAGAANMLTPATKYGYALPLVSLNPVRKGFYAMARIMLHPKFYPYFTYEAADPGPNDPFPKIKVMIYGLNYKPLNVVTCKAEMSFQKFDNGAITTGYSGSQVSKVAATRNEDFKYLQMSVSYAF